MMVSLGLRFNMIIRVRGRGSRVIFRVRVGFRIRVSGCGEGSGSVGVRVILSLRVMCVVYDTVV